MLMSSMTAEEEESVQKELAELQAQAIPTIPKEQEVELPSVPQREPETSEAVREEAPASRGRVAIEV